LGFRHQAAGTIRRDAHRRFAGQRFGLFGVDEVGQSARQEIHDAGDGPVRGGYVRPAVPIEDLPPVRQSLNPELRDAAIPDFPFRVVGMLREDQRLEAVPVQRSANPSSRAGGAPRGLCDLQVETQVEVLGVRRFHCSFSEVGRGRWPMWLSPRGVTQLPCLSPGIQRLTREFLKESAAASAAHHWCFS
jgi:hypothetical protein